MICLYFQVSRRRKNTVELHAFPEGHPDIAKYLHQLSLPIVDVPYHTFLLATHRSHPSCLHDCEGKFLASHMMHVNLRLFNVGNVCANFNPNAQFISCIQTGIALGELTSLSDLYDTRSVALLFLIGVVSVIPALLGKDKAQEKTPEIAVPAS